MKNSIAPKEVLDAIKKYENLTFKNFKTKVPYYRNRPTLLFTPPVEAGKGDPEEIQKYIDEVIAKSPYANRIKNNDTFRKALIAFGIGLDCSGLVYNLLDIWAKVKHQKSLAHFLPKENPIFIRKFFSRLIKPQSSMSADDFTSEPFARQIKGTLNIRAGDLIRTKGGHHVLMIISTEFYGNHFEIVAYQSSDSHYPHGLVSTLIQVPSDKINLALGTWIDMKVKYLYRNKSYEGFVLVSGSGVWRPKFLEQDE